jgi:hypothetical protein
LPSSRTGINPAGSSWPAASSWTGGSPGRLRVSQLPTMASKGPASASVTTRQIVAFDGGGAGRAPARRYRSASTGCRVSLTQPTCNDSVSRRLRRPASNGTASAQSPSRPCTQAGPRTQGKSRSAQPRTLSHGLRGPCPWLARPRGPCPWLSVENRRFRRPFWRPGPRPPYVRGHRDTPVRSATR